MVTKLVKGLVVVLLWTSPAFAVTLSWDPSPKADLAVYKVNADNGSSWST